LVEVSGWRRWPSRLAGQPIFYPVLNEEYATMIARDWTVKHSGAGYVTRFQVRREFLARYEVHQVGGHTILEYWIPASPPSRRLTTGWSTACGAQGTRLRRPEDLAHLHQGPLLPTPSRTTGQGRTHTRTRTGLMRLKNSSVLCAHLNHWEQDSEFGGDVSACWCLKGRGRSSPRTREVLGSCSGFPDTCGQARLRGRGQDSPGG
jgi:hypothetical protein